MGPCVCVCVCFNKAERRENRKETEVERVKEGGKSKRVKRKGRKEGCQRAGGGREKT